MPNKGMSLIFILFALLASGCGQMGLGFDPTATVQDSGLDNGSNGTASTPGAEAVSPTATAQPAAHIASGLVLSSPSQTWFVNASGQVDLISELPRAQLAADHERVLVAKEGDGSPMNDVWLLNLTTGEQVNLTKSPDRDEISPMWWPARPQIVFMVSGQDVGMANAENPTLVDLDGSMYRVLDSEHGGLYSLAPDGSAIAYGAFGPVGWIYRWDGGIESFNPADYGLNADKIFRPSWSPDGRFLAWIASGNLQGDESVLGLAVFDLEQHAVRLLHVYSPAGGGTYPHYVAWSPDGAWIAYVTYGEGPAAGREPNLWVMRPDGSEEAFIDVGLEPAWSPDGTRLAYIHSTMQGEIDLRIARSGSWEYSVVDDLPFPGQAQFIMSWLQP